MTSRERFEAHAAPMGFDLTRQSIAVPEPWAEYANEQTGYFWAGWQAAERDMLERCVYVAEQGFRRALDGNEIADKLKELLNEQQH